MVTDTVWVDDLTYLRKHSDGWYVVDFRVRNKRPATAAEVSAAEESVSWAERTGSAP